MCPGIGGGWDAVGISTVCASEWETQLEQSVCEVAYSVSLLLVRILTASLRTLTVLTSVTKCGTAKRIHRSYDTQFGTVQDVRDG